MILIKADRIGVTYPSTPPVAALAEVSMTVEVGEFVAIVGPSGSGKTTLLNAIGGLYPITRGRLMVDGIDLASATEHQRNELRSHTIGFVFQHFHLLPTRTVVSNVALGSLYTKAPRDQRRQQAIDLLQTVGLSHLGDDTPRHLSGGERQRVAIARAMMGTPQILLCDEPTGNLDSRTGQTVIELLDSLRLQRDVAVVVVTHDLNVRAAADRILEIHDGRVTTPSSPAS